MTALKQYARLESPGLWRPEPQAQRREVVVSFGDATLVIADSAGRALAHWSLAAIERLNPAARPALYSPDPEATETLEIEETLMIDAIEKVRRALVRARPREGRLRGGLGWLTVLVMAAIAFFWAPDALTRQTLAVVPEAKRAEIGARLLAELEARHGPLCRNPLGAAALDELARRVFGAGSDRRIAVLPEGPSRPVALPGGTVVLTQAMIEAADDPAVTAGHALSAAIAAEAEDPLLPLLTEAGFGAVLRLLATGDLPAGPLATHAARLDESAPAPPPDQVLMDGFAKAGLPWAPWATATGRPAIGAGTGTDTGTAGGAGPEGAGGSAAVAARAQPVLGDQAWVGLTGLCRD